MYHIQDVYHYSVSEVAVLGAAYLGGTGNAHSTSDGPLGLDFGANFGLSFFPLQHLHAELAVPPMLAHAVLGA